jgi:hypothetical protein
MENVKASIQMGEKLVTFEGPRDFVEEQVARFASLAHGATSQQAGTEAVAQTRKRRRSSATARTADATTNSCSSRILALGGGGFFDTQRTISEVRGELAARGWHYPLTTLSGRLQTLVQKRSIRREKVKDGSKRVWKYSNV